MTSLLADTPQHWGSWRRRSLIDDAKFDTVTNAQLEKHCRKQPGDDDVIVEDDVSSDVTAANGDASSSVDAEVSPPARKCTAVLSVEASEGLATVFGTLEVSTAHI